MFSQSSQAVGCTAAAMLPKQARRTFRNYVMNPSEQVAAPPSIRTTRNLEHRTSKQHRVLRIVGRLSLKQKSSLITWSVSKSASSHAASPHAATAAAASTEPISEGWTRTAEGAKRPSHGSAWPVKRTRSAWAIKWTWTAKWPRRPTAERSLKGSSGSWAVEGSRAWRPVEMSPGWAVKRPRVSHWPSHRTTSAHGVPHRSGRPVERHVVGRHSAVGWPVSKSRSSAVGSTGSEPSEGAGRGWSVGPSATAEWGLSVGPAEGHRSPKGTV